DAGDDADHHQLENDGQRIAAEKLVHRSLRQATRKNPMPTLLGQTPCRSMASLAAAVAAFRKFWRRCGSSMAELGEERQLRASYSPVVLRLRPAIHSYTTGFYAVSVRIFTGEDAFS
ncbi:MAG TPA: hypothetical protein VFO36_06740, partial [Nitrospiraceae bacterium]|nr:hypothetical protein [Nitrospiraceae bacterium]